MGSWGYGIYQNDTAGDWAVEIGHYHLTEVKGIIERDGFCVDDFDLVFSPLDVTCYICENADACPFLDYPVRDWSTKILDMFDRRFPDGECTERRGVIVDLFQRIERLIKPYDELGEHTE